MPANCYKITGDPEGFEKEVYNHLCEELKKGPDEYTVVAPFSISTKVRNRRGEEIEVKREIDGLVISPYCVFTVEIKGLRGKVTRGYNTKTEITTESGLYDFSDRPEPDPVGQANKQWKTLSTFFEKKCDFGKIFIKPIVVFEIGSSFVWVYWKFLTRSAPGIPR